MTPDSHPHEFCARIEAAATDILTLIEGLEGTDYARSRLTRRMTAARLHDIADFAAALSPVHRQAMPEVDWAGWAALRDTIAGGDDPDREWSAARGVETVLQWMRVYRQATI